MVTENHKSELSKLIKKLREFELPQVNMAELCSPSPSISWEDFLPELKKINNCINANSENRAVSPVEVKQDTLLIDVRSESEFAVSSIPGAVNFPIFDDKERHNVGLLFKQQSQDLAEQVGAYYAFQKKKAI